MALDDASVHFLTEMAKQGGKPMAEMEPVEARAGGAMMTAMFGAGPEMVRVRDTLLEADVVTPLSANDVSDTFEAQALLAGELCARTAGLVTSADVKALQSIQSRLEQAAKESDFAAVEELNIEFHSTIYRIADSPKIHWLPGSTQGCAPRGFFPTIRGWTAASAHDHRAILKALRASDSEAARAAMAGHLRHAGALFAQHLARD